MEGFWDLVFMIAILAIGIAEEKRSETDEDGKEIPKIKEYASMVQLICTTIVFGILCYWSRKWWLIPIIEPFTPVDNRIVVLTILLIGTCMDYIFAVRLSLVRVPFLIIAFIINCVLAKSAPVVSIAIVVFFVVCLYDIYKEENLSPIENALAKAMVTVSVFLSILDLIGINLSFIGLFLIIILMVILAILIQKYVMKRKF